MGKGQHSKAPMHLTASEWAVEWGGKKESRISQVKSLPFDCCALSFTPFEHPVCAPDGAVFDLLNIMPFLAKYKRHPLTGEPLAAKQLTKLTFHRNADGKYHCPVLFKPFNEWTHIVAIRPSGHVYSAEAVQTLCLKARNLKDLLTEQDFAKEDVLTLNDPRDESRRRVDGFAHVRDGLQLPHRAAPDKGAGAGGGNIRANPATARVLERVGAEGAARAKVAAPAGAAPPPPAAEKKGRTLDGPLPASVASWRPSTHHCAAGFTSTRYEPVTTQALAPAGAAELEAQRYARVRSLGKKAYARLETSLGALNLELHADLVPRTVENFVGLCKRGAYDGTSFHRLIKNFMVQGGDPTGTGTGGESLWGAPFADEFIPGKLSHSGRGVLSMANSGPHSNKAQFFLTFKSCTHLDGVHAVFGRVVGGLDVLAQIEQLRTTKDDRPAADLRIVRASVFADPFAEVDSTPAEQPPPRQQWQHQAQRPRHAQQPAGAGADAAGPRAEPLRSGVGMYIPDAAFGKAEGAPPELPGAPVAGGGPGALPGARAAGVAPGSAGEEGGSDDERQAKRAKLKLRSELSDFSAW